MLTATHTVSLEARDRDGVIPNASFTGFATENSVVLGIGNPADRRRQAFGSSSRSGNPGTASAGLRQLDAVTSSVARSGRVTSADLDKFALTAVDHYGR